MAEVLNRWTRRTDNPFLGLPQDQLENIKRELQARLTLAAGQKTSPQQEILGGLKRGVSTAADLFLQMGGLKMPEVQQEDELTKTIMTQYLLNQLDPRRQLAQAEYEAFTRSMQQPTDIISSQPVGTEITSIIPVQPSVQASINLPSQQKISGLQKVSKPTEFIQVPDGIDKYGRVKYKTVRNPEYELWEKQREQELKARGKRLEEKTFGDVAFAQTVNMFKNLVAQIKGSAKEKGGLGLLPGLKGRFHTLIRDPRYSRTASAYGQRVETALRLNRILTGQNRVIRSVVNMIMRSLPDEFDPEPAVASKIAQSLRNAYGIIKSFQQAGYTPEVLNKLSNKEIENLEIPPYELTPEENAEIERIIQGVLSTSAAPERGFGIKAEKKLPFTLGKDNIPTFSSVEEAERANLPKGTIIIINGRKAVVE